MQRALLIPLAFVLLWNCDGEENSDTVNKPGDTAQHENVSDSDTTGTTNSVSSDPISIDSDSGTSYEQVKTTWISLCEGATSESACASVSQSLPNLQDRYGMIDAWHACDWATFTARTPKADGTCDKGESIGACFYQAGGEEGIPTVRLESCGEFEGYPTYLEENEKIFVGLPKKQSGGEKFKRCDFEADDEAAASCKCMCYFTPDPNLKCEPQADICTDERNGLMWPINDQQNAPSDPAEAANTCSTVRAGNYTDWRVPTLDELRTLVRECEISENDGTCGVTDDCSALSCAESECAFCYADSWNDWGECPGPACSDELCIGCAVFPDGPCKACETTLKPHRPTELRWQRPAYCSATKAAESTPETENSRWCVRFDNGLIFLSGAYEQSTSAGENFEYRNPVGVVCVRSI